MRSTATGARPDGSLDPRRNNFNFLRFFAASLVVLSHAFELPTGFRSHDVAFALTGQPFSWYAVNLFFVVSGYLIVVSWERRSSAFAFLLARFMRLVPGLFVMLAITVVVLGAAFSTLSFGQFMTDSQTWRYAVGCLSILFVQYELPGVFSNNPVSAVNGSLWTLRYEVLCYLSVAAIGLLPGLQRIDRTRRLMMLSAAVAATAFALVLFHAFDLRHAGGKPAMLYELARLAMCFLLGGLYRQIEARMPLRLDIVLCLFVLTIAAAGTILFSPVANVATAYATFWVAFMPKGRWITWTRSAPDYSYGVYIYAFPIQQALIAMWPGMTPLANFTLGFALTLAAAALSWHFVEKPALSLKRRFSARSVRRADFNPAPKMSGEAQSLTFRRMGE